MPGTQQGLKNVRYYNYVLKGLPYLQSNLSLDLDSQLILLFLETLLISLTLISCWEPGKVLSVAVHSWAHSFIYSSKVYSRAHEGGRRRHK